MDVLKEVALSLSVTMIFFGVVTMLAPSRKTQNIFLQVISVALVSVIVSASVKGCGMFKEFDYNVTASLSFDNYSELEQTVDNINIITVENSVKDLILEKFNEQGINDFEIFVKADIFEDNSIKIIEVNVTCNKDDLQKCKQILNELGISANVSQSIQT